MKKLRVGSICTGIGGFELGLKNAFKDNFSLEFYSEIKETAMKVFHHNFPNIDRNKNIGDIKKFCIKQNKGIDYNRIGSLPDIDLLVAGTPCQQFSIASSTRGELPDLKKNNMSSSLVYCFFYLKEIKKPKYFLLENVASMSTKNRDIISKRLEVEPIEIESIHFSPQKRKRLYWCNFKIGELPKEKSKPLDNLVAWSRSTRYDDGVKCWLCKAPYDRGNKTCGHKDKSFVEARETTDGYANTLTTGPGCGSFSSKNYIKEKGKLRLLHPNECEFIQGYPENYTSIVKNNKRYDLIGNSVDPKVVEFILKGIKL